MLASDAENRRSVIIIGAGFSGTLTAVQLMRQHKAPITITLIESRGTYGPGLAYSVPSERFKLNVRAKAMGALPEAPEHFLEWLVQMTPHIPSEEFVSRRLYGEYLQQLLAETTRNSPHHTCTCLQDTATDIALVREGAAVSVSLAKHGSLTADMCVVAIGNLQRSSLPGVTASTLCRSPHSASTYGDLHEKSSLLIIGSGLSAVDAIIEAEGSGFSGRYRVISRHGRFPLAHEQADYHCVALPERWYELGSTRHLLRLIRCLSKASGSSQPVFEAMRVDIPKMWQHLSLAERRRFLRHARALWDIHRHRIPGEHRALLSALEARGRLTISAGRIVKSAASADGIAITFSSKGGFQSVSADVVILCIGPEGDVTRVDHPVVRSILHRGYFQPSSLGLGFEEMSHPPTTRIVLIGPLQRHSSWEATAVRELRQAAADTAAKIGAFLGLTPVVLQ
jgi:uncharacterized NAD(P)/FAD-binding protein YdhS